MVLQVGQEDRRQCQQWVCPADGYRGGPGAGHTTPRSVIVIALDAYQGRQFIVCSKSIGNYNESISHICIPACVNEVFVALGQNGVIGIF